MLHPTATHPCRNWIGTASVVNTAASPMPVCGNVLLSARMTQDSRANRPNATARPSGNAAGKSPSAVVMRAKPAAK